MNKPRRAKLDCIVLACAASAAAAGCIVALFSPSLNRTIVDPFADEPAPMLAPYLLSSEGWESTGNGTLRSVHGNATRTYRMFLDGGEACAVSGAWDSGGEDELDFRLEWRKNTIASRRPPRGEFEIPLSPELPEHGEFVLHVSSTGQGDVSQTEPLRFEFESPPPRKHWGAFLFYALLSVICWIGLVRFLFLDAIPRECDSNLLSTPKANRISILCLLAGCILIALHPHWRNSKDFDDFHTIGPAAALAHDGFDAGQLYFRSRVRPSFTAFAIPFNSLFPLQFASTSKWPTDNWKRCCQYESGMSTFWK